MLAFPSFTAALPLALAADALVQVEGASPCPTRVEVAQQLTRFIAPRPPEIEPDRASIESEGTAVRLSLTRADGTLVGEKRLELKAACADMAEAVALVIAIWERPIRPGLVPPLDQVLSAAGRAEAGSALTSPAPSESELAVRYPDEPTGRDQHATEQPSGEPTSRSPWRFEAGAALQSVGPLRVPGAMVEGAIRQVAGGWGVRAAFSGALWTDTAVGPGRISWTRLSGGLGFLHGWAGRRLFLDLREQMLGAALVATGHGYDETRTHVVFDPGVEVAVRPGIRLSPWFRLWLEVGLTFWPITQELRVEGVTDRVDATRWVGSLSLGGTFLSTR